MPFLCFGMSGKVQVVSHRWEGVSAMMLLWRQLKLRELAVQLLPRHEATPPGSHNDDLDRWRVPCGAHESRARAMLVVERWSQEVGAAGWGDHQTARHTKMRRYCRCRTAESLVGVLLQVREKAVQREQALFHREEPERVLPGS